MRIFEQASSSVVYVTTVQRLLDPWTRDIIGDQTRVTVWRDGSQLELDVVLQRD